MEKINENNYRALSFVQHKNFSSGLPFYGSSGDFNFVLGRSQFTPGISIKLVQLKDMSHNGDPGTTEFDSYVNLMKKMFKPGDRVRGTEMNSLLKNEDGDQVVGKFYKMEVDRSNEQIRAYIKNPETLSLTEVYADSVERIYENTSYSNRGSYAVDFNTFSKGL